MKKIMIIMSIIVILIIILSIGLVLLKIQIKKDRAENFENTINMEIDSKIKLVTNTNEFFAVNSCITKYLLNIMLEENQIVYSLLDELYVREYSITKDNIFEKIDYMDNPVFYTNKMYVKQKDYNIYEYFITGRLINKGNLEVQNYSAIIRLDKRNDIFSIIPNEYIIDKKIKIQKEEDFNFLNSSKIEDKQYNTFEFENISNQTVIVDYINQIKDNIVYDVESSYQKLDNKYRQNNFATLEEYKKYLNANITKFYTMKLAKYKISEYEDYKQYICIDENDNYYIINEYSVGDFTFMLDEYSVNISQVDEAYKSKTDKEKAVFDVQKFIRAIRDSNYRLAYSFLAEQFKQNYFKTQTEFENYVKQFFKDENINNYSVTNEDNLFIVTVTMKNQNNIVQDKKFIVNLKQGTDFELSFNV